jgi:acetyl-CoA acyltransferase
MSMPDQIDAVIVDAVRTPFGRRGGALRSVHPVVLGGLVVRELLSRSKLAPESVGQIVFGCANQANDQALNVARNIWLTAGLPVTTAATTVDVRCGSSEQALHFAANLIAVGAEDVVIAGGVESMTRVPMGAASPEGDPRPEEYQERFQIVPQGISAEMMAKKYSISRREMDEFALRSHQLAQEANDGGRLLNQLVPVELEGGRLSRDEGVRAEASYATISQLKPAFDPAHSITAGNSSQISDGAAALLVMSSTRAKQLGLRPMARIIAQAVVGTDPVLTLDGPIPATDRVLKKAGLSIDDIDLFEVNEAFASVVLSWQKVTCADMKKVNVNGGAIAIGHPLGASGARLTNHLIHELERRDLRFGLQTMCCGGGIGIATIIDRVVDSP